MKKNSILKKNNKGIAMVTIMITIMFLAIIATTLLYISTTNYMMKVSNLSGKENFYETDGVLVKTSSAIRNITMKNSTPLTAVNQLKTVADDSCTTYNMLSIAQLVYPSATGGADHAVYQASPNSDKIEFKTTSQQIIKSGPTAGVTTYTFKDIEIIQTSAEGYKNSVKTDLKFEIFEKVTPGGSAGGVGNMSMMLDSPLVLSTSNFKCLTLTGNCFMADYDGEDTFGDDGHNYVCPGSAGLVLTTECKLNLKGKNNVIYGDLNLSGSSSLAIYGDLTVYGDITVSGNASLILAEGGKIYQYTAEALPGRTAPATKTLAAGCIYPAGLSIDTTSLTTQNFKDFADTIGIDLTDNASGEYGLIKKIFKPVTIGTTTARVTDLTCKVTTGSNYSTVFSTISMGDAGPHGFRLPAGLYNNATHNIACAFLGSGCGNTALNADYKHMLLISLNDQPLNMQESNPYTTWISNSSVTCSQAHCVTLSKVGTDEFNYMTAAKEDTESAAYNNTSNPFNKISFVFDGVGTYEGAFGDFFEKDCNTYVDQMFGYSVPGGSAGSKTYASAMNFSGYSRDFE